jgi:hypothetical protein
MPLPATCSSSSAPSETSSTDEWRIVHHEDRDPSLTGWYLVLPTPGADTYDDVIGPYDTKEIAQQMKDLPE